MKKLLFAFYCWNIMGERSGYWGNVYNMALDTEMTKEKSGYVVAGVGNSSADGTILVYAYTDKNLNIVNRYILEKKASGFITVPNNYLNMYPFRYKKGNTIHLELITHEGSKKDEVKTMPMPTLDVSATTYSPIKAIINATVMGDKWNGDEVVTIELNITYERRASHRNYYNGNSGTLRDDVLYYEGNETNIEYEGKATSWDGLKKHVIDSKAQDFKFIYGNNGYE